MRILQVVHDFLPKSVGGKSIHIAYVSKMEHGTVNQVMTALREHPLILQGILQLPAVNKSYRVAKAIVPAPLWNRLKNVFISRLKIDYESPASLEKPILPLTNAQVDFFCARTHIRIDKAKRLLGYQPNFYLEQGMELTENWLRFANLI